MEGKGNRLLAGGGDNTSKETSTDGRIDVIRMEYKRSKKVAKEIIGSHSIHCDQNLFLMQLNKNSHFTWNFTIMSKKNLPVTLNRVFSLMPHMPEFCINNVKLGFYDVKLEENCQFWECSEPSIISIQISISFMSPSYGKFEQEFIFEFQNGDKILRHIGVEVLPEAKLMETLKFKPAKDVESEISWIEKFEITPFDGEPEISFGAWEYPLPPNLENLVAYGGFNNLQKKLTRENYRERLHLLLYIEEIERRQELQKLSFEVDCINDFIHSPIPGLHSNRILRIPTDDCCTEQACRLIGKSGKALVKIVSPCDSTIQVFEVRLEQILCNEFVFEMSSQLDLHMLKNQSRQKAIFCFRFVDVFQFMHRAIEKISTDDVFPLHHLTQKPNWSACKYENLTKEQSVALNKMIENSGGPPVLLLGPFGSGKTRTMAYAILELYKGMKMRKEFDKRILICTHSNSAADHYIENFIDPFLVQENPSHPVLIRVNWELRYTASVSERVLKYCKVRSGKFVPPRKEDIERHIIVISTLVTANLLHEIGVGKDFFTHIFIDEAAQAMEVEAIIPLMFKGVKTKVILAGDHLQLGFPLVSTTAKDLGLGISLLERLFKEYPADSQCKLKLLENHRSFQEIVEISSSLFYEGALVSNKPCPHEIRYPVQFYGVHGEEKISRYHPSAYNLKECSEVLHRIQDLMETWPSFLGGLTASKICVLSCYSAQIQEIRLLLRKNGLSSVRVENVNNVQGLEFDVVIISTVKCYNELTRQRGQYVEFGFLGSPKLLNTAVTRAKYFCIVIGEPVALISFGACKALWKTVLAMCSCKGEFNYQLTYKEVMELSEELREVLGDDHTSKCSLSRVTAKEEYLLFKSSGSKKSDVETSSKSSMLSVKRRDDGANFSNQNLRSEISIPQRPDAAVENSETASPTPSNMSSISDISTSDDLSSRMFFNAPASLRGWPKGELSICQEMQGYKNVSSVATHAVAHDNHSLLPANLQQRGLSLLSSYSQPLSSQQCQPRHSLFQQHPLNPSFADQHDSAYFTHFSTTKDFDDIKKLSLELDTYDSFVSDFYAYCVNQLPQTQNYTSHVFATKNESMSEIRHLLRSAQNLPADRVLLKCRSAYDVLSQSMHLLDKVLLQFLPVVPTEVFNARQANFDRLKESFLNLRLLVERLLQRMKSIVSVNQTPHPHLEAGFLHNYIVFIIGHMDSWMFGLSTPNLVVTYSYLFEFKLNFLIFTVRILPSAVNRLEDITLQLESYQKYRASIETKRSPVPHGRTVAGELEVQMKLGHEDRSNDFCFENALPKDCLDAITSDVEDGDKIVKDLIDLTTENPYEYIDDVDDLVGLIKELRHHDNDVDEWFVNRETDVFVSEYIESFERYRAILASDHHTPTTTIEGGDTNPSPNKETRFPKDFNVFKRFEMEVPYPKYRHSAREIQGVMSYEKASSCEKPLGVILNGKRSIYFPGLKFLNRSLDGDEVLFHVVGKYGKHDKGHVTYVTRRGKKSLECKVSLHNSHLFIPVDERGPAIIPLNASKSTPSGSRHVGGGIQKYIVKVIGWPVNMKFPLGLIQRDAQEHFED